MAAESTSFVLNRWITMPSALWSFTLDFYARPGVEQACLTLQANGANVCMVLCGVWLGTRDVACDAQRVAQIKQWRHHGMTMWCVRCGICVINGAMRRLKTHSSVHCE